MFVPVDRSIRRVAITSATVAFIFGGALISGVLPSSWAATLSNTVYLVPALGAGLALSLAASRLQGRERIAWALLAGGVVTFAAGDVVWIVVDVLGGADSFLPADILYLASYPLWLAGALVLPFARAGRLERARVSLDGLATGISIALLGWHLYLRQIIQPGADTALDPMSAAYAFGDILLLALVVLLLARRNFQRFRLPTVLLAGAMTANAAADIIYATASDYSSGIWYDGLWTLFYAAIALVAWALLRPATAREHPHRLYRLAATVVSYGPVVLLLVVMAMDLFAGEMTAETRIMTAGTACVVAAVLCRQMLALGSQRVVSERIQRDLIATVAHELRTPLTAMQGFTDILANDWQSFSDDEREELLRVVNDQTRHLNHIVGDLVTAAKGTIGRQELRLRECDLSAVLTDAAAMSGVGRSVDLRVVTTPEVALVADRRRLIQAVVNLLANAGHYGRGQVLLKGYRTPGSIVIEVHDDGPGVPDKYRQVVWERFERGPYRLDPSKPGTGVGLAIVRAIVEAHGGEACYKPSNDLGGACFIISLPVHSGRKSSTELPITAGQDITEPDTVDNLELWMDPFSNVSPTSQRVATHR